MGAYSPVALATPALLEVARRRVYEPVLEELRRRGTPFSGVLYAGLMVDGAGVPSVVEFNCRLGDPETQVVLPLVTKGLTDAFWRIAHGERPSALPAEAGAAVTTVLAARGYPDRPEKGAAITIPEGLPAGVTVFHAGTAHDEAGVLRVAGGRVLNVTAVAPSFAAAQRASRAAADQIQFDGRVYRTDIGWREAARLGSAER
jgi:phosphoribosylamine--glycine ligase